MKMVGKGSDLGYVSEGTADRSDVGKEIKEEQPLQSEELLSGRRVGSVPSTCTCM